MLYLVINNLLRYLYYIIKTAAKLMCSHIKAIIKLPRVSVFLRDLNKACNKL
jgi:hypothetical protein